MPPTSRTHNEKEKDAQQQHPAQLSRLVVDAGTLFQNHGSHIYHQSLCCVAPMSFGKESLSLDQGGVWCLFSQHSHADPSMKRMSDLFSRSELPS